MPIENHIKLKIKILLLIVFTFISCKKETESESKNYEITKSDTLVKAVKIQTKNSDTIELSKKHKINRILCDLDGDKLNEIVEIVRSKTSGKSGLRITFGNGNRTDYFGMGTTILNQGFDEIDWVGVFEKAPKNKIYWNNVNDDGDILTNEEIKESDKIKLLNDGIYMHEEESCGGGIIYLINGKYEWIQQE